MLLHANEAAEHATWVWVTPLDIFKMPGDIYSCFSADKTSYSSQEVGPWLQTAMLSSL